MNNYDSIICLGIEKVSLYGFKRNYENWCKFEVDFPTMKPLGEK